MATEKHRILAADDLDLDSAHGKARTLAVATQAAWLAKKLRASLDFLYVQDLKSYPSDRPYIKDDITRYFMRKEGRLRELPKSVKIEGETFIVQGSPVQEILRFSRKSNLYDLIVLGTHGRKGASRILLGSVSEEIVRNSTVPVMVIGPNTSKPKGKDKPKVMLATDLGPNSQEAEEFAVNLCRKIDATLVLFHCLSDNFAFTQSAFVDPLLTLEMLTTLQEEKKENLGALEVKKAALRNAGIDCEVRYDQKSRTADEAILKEAKKDVSLIVMGTHGRNLIAAAFLGGTAREVILAAPVPTIVVRSRK